MLGAFGALAVAALGVLMVARSITDVSVTTTFPGGRVSGSDSPITTTAEPTNDARADETGEPDPALYPVPPPMSPTPSPTPATRATLDLTATGVGGYVEVRLPEGRALYSGDLPRGARLVYTEARLKVLIGDTSVVRVLVNGKLRPPGGVGGRESFVATRR